MVIDSGAAETLVPASALSAIGVSISKDEIELAGVGGARLTARLARVRIEFGGGRFVLDSRVAAVPEPFTQPAILGSRDFFLRYYVAFAARDGVFYVRDYEGSP